MCRSEYSMGADEKEDLAAEATWVNSCLATGVVSGTLLNRETPVGVFLFVEDVWGVRVVDEISNAENDVWWQVEQL